MDLKSHPFYNCHTGQKIIIELSKLLHDTGYIVMLPECSSKLEYHITAAKAEDFGIKDANGKFVVFNGDMMGGVMIGNLKPDMSKTNWLNYGNALLGKLTELIELFKIGKRAVKLEYLTDIEGIPKVEIVSCGINMNIKSKFV